MIGLLLAVLSAYAQNIVVQAETVYPVSGPPITDGVVVVENGKITAVGPSAEVTIPSGLSVIKGAVAVPGIIDGLSVAGLTGAQNKGFDQDHREGGGRVMPQLQAIDSYNGFDSLVSYLRHHGVTTIHTGPSPGKIIGARTLVTKTRAAGVSEVVLRPDAWIAFTMGERSSGTSTRMGSAAVIREALAGAVEYNLRRKLSLADRPPKDLGKEVLVEALQGLRKVVVQAHRAQDIQTAMRIADEFGIKLVIAGGAEAYLVRDELAAAEIPVLVGPVMIRAWNASGEAGNASFENATLLDQAGVTVGIMSGYESYVPKVRVVLWEAAIAGAYGLGFDGALRAVTLTNAELLGIDDRVGSLEVGKDGDIVVYDGDPFEYTSHACAVIIDGEQVSDECY
jgi:imidazolonepropionase-like amidohydrolase